MAAPMQILTPFTVGGQELKNRVRFLQMMLVLMLVLVLVHW